MKKWVDYDKKEPEHKALVLAWDGEISVPAIYYKNNSYHGFWHYTNFYELGERSKGTYGKTRLKLKHRIDGILKWRHIDAPQKN
jgi:hypothetical protein